MTTILSLTEAIYCNIFRCIYLKKEKYFLINMVNGPKHCSKLNGITFTIFIDSCEDNWIEKKLS